MKPQSDSIKEIDRETNVDKDNKPFSLVRLVFYPPAVLLKELVLKGGLIGGVEAVKNGVNLAALSFVAEAKRYERDHGDKREMEKDSRDFL